MDENSEERARRVAADKKNKIQPGMSASEIDEVLGDEFFDWEEGEDCPTFVDEHWDPNMDEFEYIDAPGGEHAPSPGESSEFDPDDEDSCRKYYIERQDAEWMGPESAPKVGSFPGVDRRDVQDMANDSWCAGYGESFKLRIGPNYKKYGKKDHSKESMYSVVAVDFVRASTPTYNIGAKMRLPKVRFNVNSQYVQPVMIINTMLPYGGPWVFSRTNDGPCLQMVVTLIMKEKYAKMWDQLDRAPASCRQLEEYMRIAPEENGPVWDKKDDGNKKTSYRWRWKFIGRGENGVPAALKSWNGKPALITQDGRLHRGDGYVEMDINIADWCLIARKALYTMFQTVPERKLSLGHVIEAREDEHMPEQTLCCMQVCCLSFFTDKAWEDKEAYLAERPSILDGDKLFG